MFNIYTQLTSQFTKRFFKMISFAALFTVLSFVQSYGQITPVVPSTAPGLTVSDDYMPFGTFWGFQRSQMQYTDAELATSSVALGNHWITQVGFYISNASGKAASTPVVIHMKQKSGAAGLTTALYNTAVTGYSQVYSGTINSSAWATGTWVMVTLTNPFYYTSNGTNNLEVIVETNYGGSGSPTEAGSPTTWARTALGAGATNQRFQRWTADGQPSSGFGTLSTDRPDIKLAYFDATACAAPGIITTSSSLSSVCSSPAQQFTLSLSGIISPPASVPGGYTYQWETGPTAGGPWTNVVGATSNTLVTTAATTTYYHCLVTCGSTSTSSAILVSAVSCYCIPSTNFTSGTDIGQIIFGSLTNPATLGSATNNPLASNSFTDYTSVVSPCFTQGLTYPITIKQITSGSTFYSAIAHIFIDWNQDGILSTTEDTYLSGPTGPTGGSPTITSLSTSITIPWNAVPGNTRMRVILRDTCCGSSGSATNQSCDIFNSGEIEDYTICISAAATCNVTATGTVTSTAPSVCTAQPFTLDVTGNTGYGSGMTFQWEVSTTGVGGSFSAIAGSNTYPFVIANQTAASCYRLRITCPANAAGAAQYTSVICVGQNASNLCMCTPIHPACPSSPYISNVTLNTLNNTTTCNNGNGNAYTIYPPALGTTTPLVQGASYTLSTTTQLGNSVVEVWIDFNADGVLSNSELFVVGTNINAGVATSIPITIPLSANPGQCVMRVRTGLSGWPIDACSSMISGEAEDYTITIVAAAPTPCTALNSSGRTITSLQSYSNICSGSQITFSLSPSLSSPIVFSGLTYLWEIAPVLGGPWSGAGGINTNGTYTGIFTTNIYLRVTITCNSGSTYTTPAISITIIPATWLGFTDDWSDATNWCGRIPTLSDKVQINKTTALAIRGAGIYYSPVAALKDSVRAFDLDISNLDSMTVITDTLVNVDINNNLSNSGKLSIISSAQSADTATIGTGTIVSPILGQIFRGNQNDQIVQVIYNVNELLSIGLQAGNNIDSLLFQFRNRASANVGFQNFTISYLQVPTSTLSSFSSSNPYVGAFTPVYTTATLNTNAPAFGQWTPYTNPILHTFSGTVTSGSSIISFVSPAPNVSPNQVFLGDTIYATGLVPYRIVTGIGSNSITINTPATTSFVGSFQSRNSGGWLRLSSTLNPFVWNGVDNILLQICFNNGAVNASATDEMLFTSTSPVKSALFLSNGVSGAANDGCTLTSASPFLTNPFGTSPSVNRPNITLRFHNPSKRLTANVGGQVLNNSGAKMWVSTADLLIGSNLKNDGSFYFQDSSYTRIGGDMINTGTLQGTNFSIAKKSSIQFNGTNWTNNGTIIPGNSRVSFGTATAQIIGGSNPSTFFDFNMQKTNNADIITMNKPIIINDSIALRLGQLRMNKNSITINNSNTSALSRQISGTSILATTVSSATTSSVTTASIAGVGIGDLMVNTNLSTTPATHVVGINGSIITFYPTVVTAPVGGSAIKFYKAGYLIGEDSLSKVNWLIDAVTGNRTIPFANITTNGATNPLHIPINFSLAVTNAVDMDTVSFATYKAPLNLPLPPTVTHLNSAGPVAKTLIGTTTLGSNIITGIASTIGVLVGDQITGSGIPLGTTVLSTTATTITLSVSATITAAGITFTTGIGIAAGNNNDAYTADRFWIISKTSAPVKFITGNTTSGSTTVSGVTPNTTGIIIGQTVFGAGIPVGTSVTSLTATTITLSAAATQSISGNNIVFNYPLTALTFTMAYDERPCANGVSPFTCANSISNPFRPQPWFKKITPNIIETWERLQYTGTPYSFSNYMINTITNTNYNVAVTNYPWMFGNYTPWAITTQNQPLGNLTTTPKPTILSFTPTSAAATDTVKIFGSNFNGTTNVSFGATNAASFNVVSNNQINAIVAGGASGFVAVTNAIGKDSLNGFTFLFPVATISGSSTACLNDTTIKITFIGSKGKAPFNFIYTINGGTPITVTSIIGNSSLLSVPTNNAGSFNYLLTSVSDSYANSQVQSGNLNVTVSSNAPAIPGAITGITKPCPGDTGIIYSILNVANASSYNWLVPSGCTISSGSGTNSIKVNFALSFNNGTVSVSAANACGISIPKSKYLSKNIPGTPSAINGPAYAVCSGSTNTYSISVVSFATTYTWTVPPGVTINSGQGTTSVSLTFPANFISATISVAGGTSCGYGTARTLFIRSIPTTPLTITGPITVCANQVSVAYSTALITGATSYSWVVPSGATITSGQGTNSIVINYGPTGGNVKVKGINACGSGYNKVLPVTIVCREGLNESDYEIRIYPNPSNSTFRIDTHFVNDENYNLVVKDVLGRDVEKYENINSKNSFTFGKELIVGMYFVEITNGNNHKIIKVIKNK